MEYNNFTEFMFKDNMYSAKLLKHNKNSFYIEYPYIYVGMLNIQIVFLVII